MAAIDHLVYEVCFKDQKQPDKPVFDKVKTFFGFGDYYDDEKDLDDRKYYTFPYLCSNCRTRQLVKIPRGCKVKRCVVCPKCKCPTAKSIRNY